MRNIVQKEYNIQRYNTILNKTYPRTCKDSAGFSCPKKGDV